MREQKQKSQQQGRRTVGDKMRRHQLPEGASQTMRWAGEKLVPERRETETSWMEQLCLTEDGRET